MAGRPAVFVMSQFPELAKHIQALLTDIAIKDVKLSGIGERFLWNLKVTPEEKEELKDAEIIVTDNNICGQLLYSLPRTKWVQCTFTGVNYIFSCMDQNKQVPSFTLTRYAGDVQTRSVAEYVLGQIICWERKFHHLWDLQQKKSWQFLPPFEDLQNYVPPVIGFRRVCVLGVGYVGKAVAKALKAQGVTVVGFAKHPREPPEEFDRLETNLAEALSDCNYICNVLPDTPETRNFLGGDVLSHCGKKPVFINVGRGNIITERELLHALKQGWLSGAVLDVFDPEPLDVTSELWTTPNVIITPHIGAIASAKDVAASFAVNYKRYIAREKLLWTVDWNLGY